MEFEEGANAVHCGYCGSDHVVTGQGRVLSYYIPERIDARQAAGLARDAFREDGERGWRVDEATLFFVPYFRFTGDVLQWDVRESAPQTQDRVSTFSVHFGVVSSEDLLYTLTGGTGSGAERPGDRRYDLTGSRIDRSMPALDVPELKTYSLGLRPGTLKLRLFADGELCRRGVRAPVRLDIADREERGFAALEARGVFARAVFAKSRSVIFFPFWLIEAARKGGGGAGDGRRLLVVDAVAGKVVNDRAEMSVIEKLVDKVQGTFDTAGFRPLKCPNCAADLPVRPKDVVFFCNGCSRAWHIDDRDMAEIKYTRAGAAVDMEGEPEYFPFWVVRARLATPERTVENKYDLHKLAPGLRGPMEEDREVPFRLFMPAVRMGNLKVLSRLAATFTNSQPVFEEEGPGRFTARGSYLSPQDALDIAHIILLSIIPTANTRAVRFALDAKVEPLGAELVMVPFYKRGFEYSDGILGQTIPGAALKD